MTINDYPTKLVLAEPNGERVMHDGSAAPRPGAETDHLYTETFFVGLAQESGGHLHALRYLRAVIESAWCGNGSSEVDQGGLLPIDDQGRCAPTLADDSPFSDLPANPEHSPAEGVTFVNLTFSDMTEREDHPGPMLYSWDLGHLLTDAGLSLLGLAEWAGAGKRFKVPADIGGGAPRREKFRRDGDKSTRDAVRRTYFTVAAAEKADRLWELADPRTANPTSAGRIDAMELPEWLNDAVGRWNTRTIPTGRTIESPSLVVNRGVWPNLGLCYSDADWPSLVEEHSDELCVDHHGLLVHGAPSWQGIAKAFRELREADPTAALICRLWIAPDGRYMIEPINLVNRNPDVVDKLTTATVGMNLRHFGGGPLRRGPSVLIRCMSWPLSPYFGPKSKPLANHFH